VKNYEVVKEDTIDLFELYQQLKRRRVLILLLTILGSVSSILYVNMVRPIYEVKGVIQLAQINKANIVNSKDVVEKINFLFDVYLNHNSLPYVSEVKIPEDTVSIVVVKARAYNNNDAIKKFLEVSDAIETSQNKYLEKYIEVHKKRISLIDDDINAASTIRAALQKRLKLYEKKIYNIEKKDSALAGIYALEIGKMQSEINRLQGEISQLKIQKNDLEFSISSENIKKAKVIGSVKKVSNPIYPRKKVIVVIATIVSFMSAILFVFFLNFVQSISLYEKKLLE